MATRWWNVYEEKLNNSEKYGTMPTMLSLPFVPLFLAHTHKHIHEGAGTHARTQIQKHTPHVVFFFPVKQRNRFERLSVCKASLEEGLSRFMYLRWCKTPTAVRQLRKLYLKHKKLCKLLTILIRCIRVVSAACETVRHRLTGRKSDDTLADTEWHGSMLPHAFESW